MTTETTREKEKNFFLSEMLFAWKFFSTSKIFLSKDFALCMFLLTIFAIMIHHAFSMVMRDFFEVTISLQPIELLAGIGKTYLCVLFASAFSWLFCRIYLAGAPFKKFLVLCGDEYKSRKAAWKGFLDELRAEGIATEMRKAEENKAIQTDKVQAKKDAFSEEVENLRLAEKKETGWRRMPTVAQNNKDVS